MAINPAQYLHKRKAKYMAQTLEWFEQHVEPHIEPSGAKEAQDFKALVRRQMKALTVDAVDLLELPDGTELNGVGQHVRDQLHLQGEPRR